MTVHQGSRASVWNWSNPRHEALQGEFASRSESEHGSASLHKVRVASLPKRMKPATDGGKRVNSHWALRGDRGRRVKTDKSRNLGDPRFFFRGSRTARSSREAGNDRGAKGLNVDEQL